MRTLIDDFLPQVRPGYIALFSAHWAIELTYLTAYVCQFGQLNRYTFLTATSTIFTLSPSFLAEQPEEPSVQVVISILAAWDRKFNPHVIIRNHQRNCNGKERAHTVYTRRDGFALAARR